MALPAAAQDPDQNADEADEEETIVVVGSRIPRNEFTSVSPIQVITAEQNALEGMIDTSQILQGSSVSSGSQQINNQFTGFVVNGGPGVNTVSLRGLGANRTLVLLNGRRLNPAGTRGAVGAVDLNVIPESMIDRIEILKDGASSIYGSDAVAGVVNVVTRDDYDGLVLEATGMVTEHGGGENYQISGTWGHNWDRGNVLAGAEYYRRESLTWGERDYLDCASDMVWQADGVFGGVTPGRLLDIIDPATGQPKCFNLLNGVIDAVSFSGPPRFVPDPTAVNGGGLTGGDRTGLRRVGLTYAQVAAAMGFPANTTNPAVEAAWRASQAEVPTDTPLYDTRDAISPVERLTLFATGALDLTPDIELYGEVMYNRRESSTASARQIFPNVSAFNPNTPAGLFAFSHWRSIVPVPSTTDQEVDFYRGVMGVRGGIGSWSYDLYAQYGLSDGTYGQDSWYNDRVLGTTGSAGCSTTNGGFNDAPIVNISGFDCSIGSVDWAAAATNGFSQAELAFLTFRDIGQTEYEQQLIGGTLAGELFELPAGPLGAAFGFEYREESIDDQPGPMAQAGNLWGQTSAGRTKGEDSVQELFGELEVPLLAGLPLIESLTAQGSYRWTEYDSFGDDETYKIGLNWVITPEYRLRGTYGTSFRAPALFEMFLANQTGFLGQAQIDPCISWDTSPNPAIVASCGPGGLNLPVGYNGPYSSALILTGGGGPGVLNAETSEATTLGFVWTPDWMPFSAAIDYFNIEVNNQVAQFGAGNIVTACHLDPGFPASPFCTLFNRDTNPASPTFGMITQVNNSFVNLNSQITEGLDLTLRYEHEFSFGTFRIEAQTTWTFKDEIEFFTAATVPNAPPPEDFNGELVDPDFVGNVAFRFDRGDWTYFWDVDMVSRASNDEDFGGNVFGWRGTPFPAYYKQYAEFYAAHNGSIRYRGDNWTFQFGVQNIFDEPPPAISTGSFFARLGTTPLVNQYDILGRRYWASISREF